MNQDTVTPATFGNVFEDVLEVLWAPSVVYDRARSRAYGKYMLVLLLVAAVITVIAARLIAPWLDASFVMSMQLAAAKGQQIPAQAMNSARKFGAVGFYVSPLFIVVAAGFVGGLLLRLGARVAQAPITYGQAVLIATLAAVPRILSLVASAVMALVANADAARSMYDLSIGPARFLDPLTVSPVLMQLLAGLDVFNLWQLALFTIGVSVMGKVSRSTGFVAALVAWALGTALPLLPTLLAS